jgi:hypothetical protein
VTDPSLALADDAALELDCELELLLLPQASSRVAPANKPATPAPDRVKKLRLVTMPLLICGSLLVVDESWGYDSGSRELGIEEVDARRSQPAFDGAG